MTNKCNQCKKLSAISDGIRCAKCNSFYHRSCITISSDGGMVKKWSCASCKPATGAGPPVGPLAAAPLGPLTTARSIEQSSLELAEEAAQDAGASLAREIKLLRASVTREMGSMRLELSRLNTIVADFSKRVDAIEERLDLMERAARPAEDADVNDVVAQLRLELNDREQDTLLNDVEIAGLDERPGENLTGLVLLAAKKVGIALEERDIVSADRRGPKRTAADGPGRLRPRPIVVRLARRAVRDALLRAARVRRGAESSGVVEGEVKRYYINERLTASNRHLLYKAREQARAEGWRYVWSRGGRIYARRDEHATIRRVRALEDVAKFFENDPN